jgi:aryl-alcohol dehydrogenase-like predicted oxidoreductase
MSHTREFEKTDLRLKDPKFQEPRFTEYLRAVDLLAQHAKANYGKSVLAFAVRWILDRGDTMTALWGAKNAAQLDQVEEAFGWKLSADDYTAVDQILLKTVLDPVGPEFMAPPKK